MSKTITAVEPTNPAPAISTNQQMPRKAAAAAFLGSALEYYDFFIYGTAAALVFNKLFFPQDNPSIAAIGALATFGVAYIARPIGGIVLGHFGDKIGRKKVLLLTLVIMGLASIAIGLLPTYDQIGIFAPILLVICRLAQGFSAGGEAAGASSLTLEHSPEGRRGFFTSFTMTGYAAGMVLATLVFIPITSLDEEALYAWGWRIPFLLSVVMLVVAWWVRRRLDETPTFEDVKDEGDVASIPALEVLKKKPFDVARVLFASLFAITQSVFTVFGLAYATSDAVGMERSTMLWIASGAIATSIVLIPVVARWSDKIGRRPVWITGAFGSIVSIFGYFWAISMQNVPLILLFAVLCMGLFYSMINGLWPAFFTEMFAAPTRYSGFAIGTQLGFLVAGFGPSIGWAIMGDGVNGWIPVGIMTAACLLISATAAFTAKETAFTKLEDLGK